MLTIESIKNKGWLIFEAITGSKAYGLDTEKSDTDIRGVFILPKQLFYSLDYIPQVSNVTNDIVYFELKRFMELLSKNNPNIMEMLAIPGEYVLHRDKIFDQMSQEMFLSRLCEKSFGNYAFSQIRKAYGLEKKIINPVEKERKSVLDFCFVYIGKEVMPVRNFLSGRGWDQSKVGLTAIPHMRDCHNLYYADDAVYSGIIRKEDSNDVSLSAIPKGETPVAMLYFNRDGYSGYCKKYKEYWEWVEKRNADRYKQTMEHGKKYDSKNMMHVFRLLQMAKEIATEGVINVSRKDREFLLSVRNGNYEYEELLKEAEALKSELPALYQRSGLPDGPDLDRINELLVRMREKYYEDQKN